MNNIIRIGTILNLNERYSSDYKYAIVSYNVESKETIVELWSNWTSSYNKTIAVKYTDPLEVIKEYQP